jgi:hypothetical protein
MRCTVQRQPNRAALRRIGMNMPKFMLVRGKPGLPVANPHASAPGVLVGMRRKFKDYQLVEEDCFERVIPWHVDLVRAVSKGMLEQVGKTIEAKDMAEAMAKLMPGQAAPPEPELSESSKGKSGKGK